MSYSSGEAAEQVVRMTLNGAEVAAKITGKAAERLAVLIYAVLRDQKKTRGKTRLTSMLKSGKEIKVFSISDRDLEKFCREGKKYGVLYCVLKDKTNQDGHTDVFVRAEDASKVNRIFERFNIATADIGSATAEIVREMETESPAPLTENKEKDKEDAFVNALWGPDFDKEEQQAANPTQGPNLNFDQFGPFSERLQEREETAYEVPDNKRPAVRQALEEIRVEQAEKQKNRFRIIETPREDVIPVQIGKEDGR